MEPIALENLKSIFTVFPEIKLVYFFGSRAEGNAGPLSDYDFAVYFDIRHGSETDREKIFDIKYKLMDRLSRALHTNAIDVVILNVTESPELKYEIIKNGILLYEQEPFSVLVEPKILREYFELRYFLTKYHVTKA